MGSLGENLSALPFEVEIISSTQSLYSVYLKAVSYLKDVEIFKLILCQP